MYRENIRSINTSLLMSAGLEIDTDHRTLSLFGAQSSQKSYTLSHRYATVHHKASICEFITNFVTLKFYGRTSEPVRMTDFRLSFSTVT